MTGLDFSQPALDTAATIATQIGITSARFVAANVYDAATVLAGQAFDIVYTSIGSLQFLPDIDGWAAVVARLVTPGGFCYVTEGHPFQRFVENDGRTLRGNYFSRDPILLNESTYANPGVKLEAPASVEWVHHPAEVVSALGAAGLRVEFLHERDWTSHQLFSGMVRHAAGHWRFPEGHPQFPLLYSLRAAKDDPA